MRKNLQIVGHSLQETGDFQGAEDLYKLALRVDPSNLDALLGLRRVWERSNDAKKIQEVNLEIDKVLSPKKIEFKDLELRKGRIFKKPLFLDGQDIVLDIHFEESGNGKEPLLSVFFNDRMVMMNTQRMMLFPLLWGPKLAGMFFRSFRLTFQFRWSADPPIVDGNSNPLGQRP